MAKRMTLLLTLAFLILTCPSYAEIYIAGYGGILLPHDFSDAKGTGTFSTRSTDDGIGLKSSVLFGAKVGGYTPALNWLGAEMELNVAYPHSKQQTIGVRNLNVAAPGVTLPASIVGTNVRVITGAFNVLVRYPGMRLEPYVGVGIAVMNVRESSAFGTASDTAPGLNALAGLKVYFSKTMAGFVEGKYTRADLSFDKAISSTAGVEGTYSTSGVVGGLSLQF